MKIAKIKQAVRQLDLEGVVKAPARTEVLVQLVNYIEELEVNNRRLSKALLINENKYSLLLLESLKKEPEKELDYFLDVKA